jgi:hypothetical protein
MSRIFTACAASLLFQLSTPAMADLTPKTREYRPLVAKAVRIEVSAQAESPVVSEGTKLRTEGWGQFDQQNWEKAIDLFLSALDVEPSDQSSAEGLTMSLYRSGDYVSVARLGDELMEIMPDIKKMVARTLEADVLDLVNRDQVDRASALLAHFPGNDLTYLPARDALGSALTVESDAQKGKVTTASGETLAGN